MAAGLVSVIIPAYKCENVIATAIESVLGQTYEDVELIVVNDGSPDNVESAVEKFRERIRYVRQENGGVSKARNTGIRLSKGKYVAFLDADDAWDKEKLGIQVAILEKHPKINMLFSSFHMTRSGTVLNDKNYKDNFNFFKEYKYDIPELFSNRSSIKYGDLEIKYYWGNVYDRLFLGNFILPSSVIARRDSIIEAGNFNEKLKVAEETDFFLRYSSRNDIGFIDCPIVLYEMPSSENLSGKSNMENLIKNAYRIQIDSLIEHQNHLGKKPNYYFKGISNTYCRLAYYFLSELKTDRSRKYALFAMKICGLHLKPYLLWGMSVLPCGILKFLGNMKNAVKTQ